MTFSTSSMVKAATLAALTYAVHAHPHAIATRGAPGEAVPYHHQTATTWAPSSDASASLTNTVMNVDDMPAYASKWLAKNFNHTEAQMSSGFQDDHTGVFHYYSSQSVDGLTVVNGVADVHLDKYGNPLAASDAFAPVHKLARRDQAGGPTITASEAVASYATAFGYTVPTGLAETVGTDGVTTTVTGAPFAQQAITAKLALYQTGSTLEKVWSLSVQTADAWHNAFVSTADGSLVGKANWQTANFWNPPTSAESTVNAIRRRADVVEEVVDHREMISKLGSLYGRAATTATPATGAGAATTIPDTKYLVLPFGSQNLDTTPPIVVSNPFDPAVSPLGWHDLGDGNGPLATTAGNNVVAQENHANLNNPLQNHRPAAANFDFSFKADDKTQQPPAYVDASITNMFFLANKFHDTLSNYGFDEKSGNFQVNQNGKGGVGQDPVIANAQDGSGTDNANFSTPPDGQPGIMRMFVFTSTNPQRDGTLENNVPIHELGHGVSSRLTGGAATANCLQTLISGGMGEGWSDFYGVTFSTTADMTATTDRPIGTYVTNSPLGVRGVPYSTNIKTNPLTYADLNKQNFQEVHQIGTVWNSMLFEAYTNLVTAHGFTADFADAKSGKGNTLMVQLVTDSLKIQPCNPTFVQSRNAIMTAEKTLTQGANACALWNGFAKRGLGVNAKDAAPFVNDFTVPPECAAGAAGAAGAGTATGATGATGAAKTSTKKAKTGAATGVAKKTATKTKAAKAKATKAATA
ncbi:Fungalysin/Thermolysin Extracellular metalloproteinase 5 [Thoreauomyces humboldtii]|nr:Fungalysin/Thermolysin Extracellular metalloproteinase 5 [Thoreauomyces humboldtii]